MRMQIKSATRMISLCPLAFQILHLMKPDTRMHAVQTRQEIAERAREISIIAYHLKSNAAHPNSIWQLQFSALIIHRLFGE